MTTSNQDAAKTMTSGSNVLDLNLSRRMPALTSREEKPTFSLRLDDKAREDAFDAWMADIHMEPRKLAMPFLSTDGCAGKSDHIDPDAHRHPMSKLPNGRWEVHHPDPETKARVEAELNASGDTFTAPPNPGVLRVVYRNDDETLGPVHHTEYRFVEKKPQHGYLIRGAFAEAHDATKLAASQQVIEFEPNDGDSYVLSLSVDGRTTEVAVCQSDSASTIAMCVASALGDRYEADGCYVREKPGVGPRSRVQVEKIVYGLGTITAGCGLLGGQTIGVSHGPLPPMVFDGSSAPSSLVRADIARATERINRRGASDPPLRTYLTGADGVPVAPPELTHEELVKTAILERRGLDLGAPRLVDETLHAYEARLDRDAPKLIHYALCRTIDAFVASDSGPFAKAREVTMRAWAERDDATRRPAQVSGRMADLREYERIRGGQREPSAVAQAFAVENIGTNTIAVYERERVGAAPSTAAPMAASQLKLANVDLFAWQRVANFWQRWST